MVNVWPKAAWFAGLLGLLGSTLVIGNPARAGGLLRPSSFASLGQLQDESGAYSINTNGSTPVMTLPDGTRINGVLDPSGHVAVFTFSSIQLDNAWITATGMRRSAPVPGEYDTDLGWSSVERLRVLRAPGHPRTYQEQAGV